MPAEERGQIAPPSCDLAWFWKTFFKPEAPRNLGPHQDEISPFFLRGRSVYDGRTTLTPFFGSLDQVDERCSVVRSNVGTMTCASGLRGVRVWVERWSPFCEDCGMKEICVYCWRIANS